MGEAEDSAGRGFRLGLRAGYEVRMQALRAAFETGQPGGSAGTVAVAARAAAVDELIVELFRVAVADDAAMVKGVALIAVGGYGRRELFPYSDVDLIVLLGQKTGERALKEPIRRLNQALWDCGLRVSAMTRTLAECERFDPENVEFTLALLDARLVAGDAEVGSSLMAKSVPKVTATSRKRIVAKLLEVTRARHARYSHTLFHLEPNIKDCPGGLRDAHVCAWLARLTGRDDKPAKEFAEAREFLVLVRTFLHFRHVRDDNTLDWQMQDKAAAAALGGIGPGVDAAYWMRIYFRHARSIERRTARAIEAATPARSAALIGFTGLLRTRADDAAFNLRDNRIAFREDAAAEQDPAHDPEVVLTIFAALAATGAALAPDTERRLEHGLLVLAQHLEDGPALWRALESVLLGPFAGRALRAMHALGMLEMLLPEFHGIDALVIRDAYHRYTVDEHTFLLVDNLHALDDPAASDRAELKAASFAGLLRDLPHPSLLYLAALLHKTGKGRANASSPGMAVAESCRMAADVLGRLAIDGFETGLVLDLIRNYEEMSAALRRDVFDAETIRAFAARVQTPEALRMLTLLTYADIRAVHPDALTPWKAERLWRLYVETASFLDRTVDDERVGLAAEELTKSIEERFAPPRDAALRARILGFLDGFPRRYLQTRTPEQIKRHVEMAATLNEGSAVALEFRFHAGMSELTLVTRDRPMLFATMAGALSAWGMNIVTADAFSNASGLVVDNIRFADTFRTLELNESERARFVESMRGVMSGAMPVEKLLTTRRRGRRKEPKVRVEARVAVDGTASSHSTLVEVEAQDTPGLLRALSLAMGEHGCNIEVALIDTEGERAIDVFYLTRGGAKLDAAQEKALEQALLGAIADHV